MKSTILSVSARFLLPLLLVFSLFMLVRGHNEPGGGFIGGLVAASGFALYVLAFSVQEAKDLLRIDPRTLTGVGLIVAVGSACVSFIAGEPFMTGLWGSVVIPLIGKIGTPFVFDVGVYCVVTGMSLTLLFAVAEE